MRQIVVGVQARRDFKAILAHSRRRFGTEREQRYRWLFVRAFADLRDNPARHGSQPIDDGRYLYHLKTVVRVWPHRTGWLVPAI